MKCPGLLTEKDIFLHTTNIASKTNSWRNFCGNVFAIHHTAPTFTLELSPHQITEEGIQSATVLLS
jgi:hypothetical protein